MLINPLALLYRHLITTSPLFEGCAPCPNRPAPLRERRASLPAGRAVIDVVYTWVDGMDPEMAAKRAAYHPPERVPGALSRGKSLYEDNDELRYSLRSLEQYAPWVRKIFIVVDGQQPAWLRLDHEKIHLVDHREIIPAHCLPTFNSHVIEAYLHRIPGLAERYIYLNDDFFLAAPCEPGDFFTPNGLPYIFTDWRFTRREGYRKSLTPHARSYANTKDYMRRHGLAPLDIIPAHVPYAQTRKNAVEAFSFFEEGIESFCRDKFRNYRQMAFYCHALPLWTYARKRAVPLDAPFYYINTVRYDREAYYQAMLREKGSEVMPLFFCLNDVGESWEGDDRQEDMRRFLQRYFPEPSSFESEGGAPWNAYGPLQSSPESVQGLSPTISS
jgi:hypothetical protein